MERRKFVAGVFGATFGALITPKINLNKESEDIGKAMASATTDIYDGPICVASTSCPSSTTIFYPVTIK